MKKRNQLTVGLIAAIIMLACACPVSGLPALGGEPTTAPIISTVPPLVIDTPVSQQPEQPQQPAGNVLYSDDFSVESAEMETYSGDDGSTETSGGVYIVRSTGDLWQWGRSTSEFDNTIVDVDVTMVTGPSNNNAGFGVVCRLSERDDTSVDGYMLAISGDGYYTIRSIAASNMTPLVDWTASDVVLQGNSTNHIRATCNNTDLSLEVNGTVVATANAVEGAPTSGGIAFATISFETDSPIAEGHFDNLFVTQP
ncbi:MAG TPA: hypothetical protein PKL78_04575 [Anaerolineales bacterium]|nr:hypothetical protein [Anaerolineales bacterium]